MPEPQIHAHRVYVEITLENALDMNSSEIRRDIERICKGYKATSSPLTHAHFLDVEVLKVETEA